MGTLDEQTIPKQVCRFLKLTTPFTGPNMKDDIDVILDEGWNLTGIYLIQGNDFAVFTRPKKQVG